ncbi:MAG: phage portal protein [Eubacteriales bacterium]|nr:phage portal protein [Eubacteriales bacterium]
MRLFNKARDKPARSEPNFGIMRPVSRSRSDWAMTNSEAIYAAVSRISNTIAMIPMHLYKGWEIVSDDPREIQIAHMPNATMNPFTFRQTMEAFRNTEGSAYALLVPREDGRGVASMDVLDASRVTPMRDPKTREIWYRFTLDDGLPVTVHSSSMIALHHMSANGERAIRPIDVLRGTLDYDRQIKEFSLSQLDGVNSGVVLNIPNTGLSPEKKTEAVKQFLSAYRDSGGRLVVLEGGITATTLNNSPVDAKVLDVERITKNRVATVYNIPPHMLGDYTDTSYSTAEQSKREYLDLTILPIVTQWENEFNLKRLTWDERRKGYAFRCDLRAMQRADVKTMADMYQRAVRGGWMKPNEVRDSEGYPPDPNGGQLMGSRDLVSLEALLKGEEVK